MSRYIIGIDLGTTNCTLSYIEKDSSEVAGFSIPQQVDAETIQPRLTLPSFIYYPLDEEKGDEPFAGHYAKDRGAEVPSRLVSSSKSWLSHPAIDRRSPFLPIGEGRMSPVQAATHLLHHLREAWEEHMSSAPFSEQMILITVPASFDPSARQLVQEAAEEAGIVDPILLEEPQAAFYAWLQNQGDSWREHIEIGDTVLVIDIGGGTTDFSLIQTEDSEGDLNLNRVAVGSHLLLGGDNLDLALAYSAKQKLESDGHPIDDWQMQQLTHVCRNAKEDFFGDQPKKDAVLTVQGRGSRLIGGQIQAGLTKNEAESLVLDGFFPLTPFNEKTKQQPRSGIHQTGLPYAQDPRISCQLAEFLSENPFPNKVLFNGGTLKAAGFRERVLNLLNQWAAELEKPAVSPLNGIDLDFAVSQGAASYGNVREGNGIRIKGGTPQSYFIGVEDAAPAVPGVPTPVRGLCVAPKGMEEGSEARLKQEFSLILGQPVQFRFFSHPQPYEVGESVSLRELTELHPIETTFDRGEADGQGICVTLLSRVTELGVLEVWCESADNRRWKLEFDVRLNAPLGA